MCTFADSAGARRLTRELAAHCAQMSAAVAAAAGGAAAVAVTAEADADVDDAGAANAALACASAAGCVHRPDPPGGTRGPAAPPAASEMEPRRSPVDDALTA